ncbi:MAG: class I SAM-dependent methyltransferase [Saprospirales bacterium]|nr:class I SAM-dependent methyltransferase [Saprospirales bacterium]
MYRLRQFIAFYSTADTVYQVHSPFVFKWVNAVLEDRRWYYAFTDIEAVRQKMLGSAAVLDVVDYGGGPEGHAPSSRKAPLRRLARVVSSGPRQGRWLFRLAQWLKPDRILELGGGVGIGTMYLAAGAPRASVVALEGSEACAHVWRANLSLLGLAANSAVRAGPFSQTLAPALAQLRSVDLVFFDGHHRQEATLSYFEKCLPHLRGQTVAVFDDIYWSPQMLAAWQQIRRHPRVTLTIDCYDLAFVFFGSEFKSKQHFRLVPSAWKPWKRWYSSGTPLINTP